MYHLPEHEEGDVDLHPQDDDDDIDDDDQTDEDYCHDVHIFCHGHYSAEGYITMLTM